MKRIITKTTCAIASLSAVFLFFGCGKSSKDVDVNNVEIVKLNNLNSDIRIVPVKCDFPMEGIYRGLAYDNYTFLLGESHKTVYCMQKDSIVSVLDASGRGHGEYSSINDFAYSQEEQILYVIADGKLMKYSVPEMNYISSTNLSITPMGMIVVNAKEILMKCSFSEDNQKDVYRGLCLVSSETGNVLERVCDLDYIGTKMFMPWDLTMVPDGCLFPQNSLTQNSILFYNTANGCIEKLFSFSFDSKWRVPKKLVKLAGKDPMLYAMEDFKMNKHLEGVHFPSIINSVLVFWCFPRENDNIRQVALIVRDGKVTCRSYIIPGIEFALSPYYFDEGYCVDIISSTDINDDTMEDNENSPLSLEIKKVANAQPFDNPVLIYFKVN